MFRPIARSQAWRFGIAMCRHRDNHSSLTQSFVDVAHKVVTRGYEAFNRKPDGIDGIFAHDPTAAVCAVDDRPFTFRRGPVRVARDRPLAGLAVQVDSTRTFSPSPWDEAPPQDVAVAVDGERVLELFGASFRPN